MAEKSSELNRTNYDELTAGRRDPYLNASTAGSDELTRASDRPEETEHIKAQIEETRAQMGETIDELQERLSFSNLSEQVSEHVNNAIETAKNTVYDATIGKAVVFMKNMGNDISDSKFVRTTRENPLPLILIGLGAGLLAYNSFSGKSPLRRRTIERYYPEETESSRLTMLSGVQEKFGDVSDKVANAASSAYEGASNAMNSAYENASDLANKAYSKAGEYGGVAGDTYDRYMRENPLVLGAAAFAVGAVVGMAIPSTDYEGQLMGETRDDLLTKAQDTGSKLLDKTKRVVNEAAAQTTPKSTQQNIVH